IRSRVWITLSLTGCSVCSRVGIVALLHRCILRAHRVVCEAVTVGPGSSAAHLISALFSVEQVLRDTNLKTVNDLLVRRWHQRQSCIVLYGSFVCGFVAGTGTELLQEGHDAFFLLPHDPLRLLWPIFQVLCEVVRQRAGAQDRVALRTVVGDQPIGQAKEMVSIYFDLVSHLCSIFDIDDLAKVAFIPLGFSHLDPAGIGRKALPGLSFHRRAMVEATAIP